MLLLISCLFCYHLCKPIAAGTCKVAFLLGEESTSFSTASLNGQLVASLAGF